MNKLLVLFARYAAELLPSLGLLVLYVLTAYDFPSIEDSGEFTLSAGFLGISHPPGYPLFALVGHLFSLLPFATLAARIHLMTAVFASTSLFLLGRTLVQLNIAAIWRSFAILALGLSPVFWSQAMTAEVYMLNLLLFSVQLWLALHLRARWQAGWGLAYGLSWGLALANHWPLAILGGAAQLLIYWPKRYAGLHVWLCILAGAALGLIPYLHLLTAARYSQFLFSGPIDDLSEFIAYVLRREYANLDAAEPASWQSFLSYSLHGLWVIVSSLHILLVPVALIGVRCFASKDKPLTAALIWALFGSNIILQIIRPMSFNSRGQELAATIQLVPIYAAYILAAVGLANLRPLARPVLLGLMALCLSVAAWHSYRLVRSEHDSFARDFAYLVLDSLPAGAVLLSDGDADAGALAYAYYGEKRRQDLTLRSQAAAFLPEPIFDRYVDFANGSAIAKKLAFIAEQLKSGRRVFTMAFLNEDGAPLPAPLELREYGIFKEVVEQGNTSALPLSLTNANIKQFLDRYQEGGYGTRWLELREKILASMCHYLLLHDERHPIMESVASCKHIEALYLNVNRKDYQAADRLFLSLFTETKDWDKKKRSQLYKEFLVNRLASLRGQDLGPELTTARYQESLDLIWPAIAAFPDCANKVALNYYEIGLQLPLKIDWDFYNKTFATCSWAQHLKKYL